MEPQIGQEEIHQGQEIPQQMPNKSSPVGGAAASSIREALGALSCKELRELLISETGDQKKYTFYTKAMLIKRISTFLPASQIPSPSTPPPPTAPSPMTTPLLTSTASMATLQKGIRKLEVAESPATAAGLCRNSSCKAALSPQEEFCRRCSCCICHHFDENKDPSLWVVCGDDGISTAGGCGLSYHLECALDKQIAGVLGDLDGYFRCSTCGAVTNLLGLWKKQLVQAKAARRVDVLYQRLMLANQLLNGTKLHKAPYNLVQEAMNELIKEIGPQTPGNLARGIVLRTSCGPKVLDLVARALGNLPKDHPVKQEPDISRPSVVELQINFKEVTSTSILLAVIDKFGVTSHSNILCYKLWHRKNRESYRKPPTITMMPAQMAKVTELKPNTGYMFKAVAYSSRGEEASCEGRCYTMAVATPRPNPKEHDSFHSCFDDDRTINEDEISSGPPMKKPKLEECIRKQLVIFNTTPDVGSREQGPTSGEVPPKNAAAAGGGIEINLEQAATQTTAGNEEAGKEAGDIPETRPPSDDGVIDPVLPMFENPDSSPPENPEDEHSNPDYGEVVPAKDDTGTTGTTTTTTTTTVSENQDNLSKNRNRSGNSQKVIPAVMALAADNGNVNNVDKMNNKISAGDNNVKALADCTAKVNDRGFEYCVRMVRWLECQGYIAPDFRKRFFTWFGLRATEHEKRVVNVYISTMLDDPVGLAGQLVDAFEVAIASSRRKSDDNDFC